jgi:preprotein translocase subunit YajC
LTAKSRAGRSLKKSSERKKLVVIIWKRKWNPLLTRANKMWVQIWVLLAGFFWFSPGVFAQEDAPPPKAPPPMWIPLAASALIVYFVLLRPRARMEREHQSKLQAVEKGDEITTKGGLIGKVTHIADKIITIEIGEKTRVKIDRDFIHHVQKGSS